MKQNIPTGLAVTLIAVLIVLAVAFGWHKANTSPLGDTTQQTIDYYKHGGAKHMANGPQSAGAQQPAGAAAAPAGQ